MDAYLNSSSNQYQLINICGPFYQLLYPNMFLIYQQLPYPSPETPKMETFKCVCT